MDTLDEVLAHFGVKGMKWGVRRSSAPPQGLSEDHMRAVVLKTKVKQGGTKSLSNKELQDFITRMNLEQQYSRIAPPSPGKKILISGARFAVDVLANVGKQQAARLVNDQATKLLGSLLKK